MKRRKKMGQLINLKSLFEKEREINKTIGVHELDEETKVIYVDFKGKKIIKTVTHFDGEFTVEWEESA